MQKISKAHPILLFFILWVIWALWHHYFGGKINQWFVGVAANAIVFAVVPAILIAIKNRNWFSEFGRMLKTPFPKLPCTVAICVTMVSLYTVRLLRGLVNSYAVFSWDFVVISVCAGVVEEFFFRAYLFKVLLQRYGLWISMGLNGIMFTLYHYPEIIFGSISYELVFSRVLLIFAMSIVFCAMLKKWNNILMNMVVHSVWDMVSFLFCLG